MLRGQPTCLFMTLARYCLSAFAARAETTGAKITGH